LEELERLTEKREREKEKDRKIRIWNKKREKTDI
jgi:hypothetical protein